MYINGAASCLSTGQGGNLTPYMARNLSSFAEQNQDSCQKTHEHIKHFSHKCLDCGSVFKDRSQLQYHNRVNHAGTRFKCPQCGCTFARKSGLNEHVKHIHQHIARYRCDFCGKGFSIRSQYFDHLATHTGVKRNLCSICNKQFTFRNDLKVHIHRFHRSEVERL